MLISHHFHDCKAPLARATHVKWRYTKYLGFSFLALAISISVSLRLQLHICCHTHFVHLGAYLGGLSSAALVGRKIITQLQMTMKILT